MSHLLALWGKQCLWFRDGQKISLLSSQEGKNKGIFFSIIAILITVISADSTPQTTTEDEWLAFETLTLCFYDTSLIDWSLMTDAEIAWINAYHARVYNEIAQLLNENERQFLAHKCEAIER